MVTRSFRLIGCQAIRARECHVGLPAGTTSPTQAAGTLLIRKHLCNGKPGPWLYRGSHNDMNEGGGEGIRDRITARGEDALGELAQFLVDNPWLHQALQVAFGARERASQASASAIRNLNLPTGNDVDRLARRLRAVSERLEEVEDTLDRLNRELAQLRGDRGAQERPPSTQA
jgi:hypothetical protein